MSKFSTKFQHPPPFSCRMTTGLFIQSNGIISCYCDTGKHRDLGRFEGKDIMTFYHGSTMTKLRQKMASGTLPWPECLKCCFMTPTMDEIPIYPQKMLILHFEPSYVCNLKCPGCHNWADPKWKGKRRFFPLDEFKSLISSCQISIQQIAFCGFGEPLLNKDITQMMAFVTQTLNDDKPFMSVDTNANIRHIDPKALVESGVDMIRFSVDGAYQSSYEIFRKKGDLKIALNFMKAVAQQKRELKNNRLKLIWKYTLFEHNDSNAEIDLALKLSGEMGLFFDYTHLVSFLNPTRRNPEELVDFMRDRAQAYGVKIVSDSKRGLIEQLKKIQSK